MIRDQFYYLGLIVLLPLLGAIFNGVLGSKLPRKIVNAVACGSILGSFFLSLMTIQTLVSGATEVGETKVYGVLTYTAYQWIYSGAFGVDIAFMVDPLTCLLLLLITGVGFLIHLYSVGYMSHDPGNWRYFSYLNLFCFAMLMLVMGKNMLVTFIGWEGVGACSYLLIGFWYTDDAKARAGQKAFIVNRVGDFAFLVGMFILFYETGTVDYLALKEIALSTATGGAASLSTIAPVAGIVSLFVFIGCTGKSAQIPLYVWLPDAMAGPTPVSALIHAATMVTSGVFLLSRLNWLFTIDPWVMMVVAWIGALTAFFAATIALVQYDIKKVLAYSTVSQLGYMFLAVGVGSFTGGVFHLMTHAFFKALLFLGSGSVIHAMSNEQDIRKMGGLKEHMPITSKTFLVGCLAISGFPLFSGFFSKDLILWSAISRVHTFNAPLVGEESVDKLALLMDKSTAFGESAISGIPLIAQVTSYGTFILGLLTAGLTAFYMFRLYFMTFEGECRADAETKSHLHESPITMTIPLIVLAVLAFVGGWTGFPHFAVPESLHGLMLGFEHWFSEVFAISEGVRIGSRFGEQAYLEEGLVTLAGTLAGLTGIFTAYVFYIKDPSKPAAIKASVKKLHGVLYEKYRVDELYNFVFVRGSIRSGLGLTLFDQNVLDAGAVDGTGSVVHTTGRVLRHLQSGNVQRYATYVTLGVVLALFALLYMAN